MVSPQFGVPLLGGVAIGKGIRAVIKSKQAKEEQKKWDELSFLSSSAQVPPVELKWRELTCTLETSNGSRDLLRGINGVAKPGRWVMS